MATEVTVGNLFCNGCLLAIAVARDEIVVGFDLLRPATWIMECPGLVSQRPHDLFYNACLLAIAVAQAEIIVGFDPSKRVTTRPRARRTSARISSIGWALWPAS